MKKLVCALCSIAIIVCITACGISQKNASDKETFEIEVITRETMEDETTIETTVEIAEETSVEISEETQEVLETVTNEISAEIETTVVREYYDELLYAETVYTTPIDIYTMMEQLDAEWDAADYYKVSYEGIYDENSKTYTLNIYYEKRVVRQTNYYSSESITVEEFMNLGVYYWGDWKFTYYQESVLPGGGLDIPGRWSDYETGFVRDGDGYICVASSDLEKGTILDTPFGMGRVYDCGCASGTIDLYLCW